MGPEYPCLCFADRMRSHELDTELTLPLWRGIRMPSFVRPALGWYASVVPFKWVRNHGLAFVEREFLRRVRPGDVAYLWSEISLSTAYELRRRGITVIREKTNCHKAAALRILEEAYRRAGMPPSHGLTASLIAKETEELALADYVFAPSPVQAETLVECGVPSEKIIHTSYGWDPNRIGRAAASRINGKGMTVLYAGTVSVRKGAHLLLSAWRKSRIRGRLLLAGPVDPAFAARFGDLLSSDGVHCLGYVKNMAAQYDAADVFAFPSLEEGGPLVTYEAAAHGLPSLVSPMGAGRIVREGLEGIIVDPYDADRWVYELQRLACDSSLGRELGKNARERAARFTWELVGAQRRCALLERVRAHR